VDGRNRAALDHRQDADATVVTTKNDNRGAANEKRFVRAFGKMLVEFLQETRMTTATAAKALITEEMKQQYKDEGYFMLPGVLPKEHLELLRNQAQFFIDRQNKEFDAKGVDVLGINHRNKRYFVHNCFKDRPEIGNFLFSDLMADVCRATLGDEAYLFWDQYVIKCADKGMKFSWHQDSGYVHPKHKPYLTCWITLDDVTEENGTVYLLPYSMSGIRTWVQHVVDPVSNDRVGYFGSLRGVPVILPAGSIAVFSSYVFHSSGANTTPNMRRVYLAQYSGEIIRDEAGEKDWGQREPFLKGGKVVR
jgi:ectoine hydroxylase-related dioxygenase (phytanoyl-CoA dioxygenase family)